MSIALILYEDCGWAMVAKSTNPPSATHVLTVPRK